MGLDVDTPKGIETQEDEARAISLFEKRFPETRYFQTKKRGGASRIDGVFVKMTTGLVVGIGETKCRYDMTMKTLAEERDFRWLITFDKIEAGRQIADLMRIDFWGWLYLVKDRVGLLKHLYDPETGWVADFYVEKTRSQRTVNGGDAVRENAFIDMRRAAVFKEEEGGQ